MTNVAERFVDAATRFSGRTFLVAAHTPSLDALSYGETLRRARSFARRLGAAGVAAGDRVMLGCPNSVEFVCAYFGILLAGGTVVPLDHRSRPAHLERVHADCGARCLVVPNIRPDLDQRLHQVTLADVDWADSPGSGPLDVPQNPLALIIYTSGTTGLPKGVCLSHDNIAHMCASILSWVGVRQSDRELLTLPLTHMFGLGNVHVYAALGATLYIEEGMRDVPRSLDIIDRCGITSFPVTPGPLRILLDRFPDQFAQKARRLRYLNISSASIAVAHLRKLLSLLPDTEILNHYGLTEAPRSTYIVYRKHPDKLESVGKATPGTEVCVGRPDRPAVGEPGEILIKGAHVTAGYWGRDSSEFFEQGWFRSGDLGIIDGDGFVTLLGRVREQINVSGLKLVPTEVEEILRQDPRVVDCAVVGMPDDAAGEVVVGFVVAGEGAADARFERQLRKLCSEHLDDYKVPRRIVFVAEIPKTDSGKVKRLALREHLPGR